MKLPRAAWVRRLVPQTLFGRLACLVAVAVVFSHFLALKLMFEVGPRLFGGPGAPGGSPTAHREAETAKAHRG